MSLKSRVIRFALALSIAGAISAQIPLNSGTALAADDYGGGGGGGGRTLITATVLALVGYGIYATVTGSGVPVAAAAAATSPTGAVLLAGGEPIYDVCEKSEDLNTFAKAADAAGLKEKLRSPGPYTAFVPTNMAFNQLDQNVLTDLLKPENKDKLAAVVSIHVVNGAFNIEQLKAETQKAGTDGFKVPTINAQTLTVTNDGGLKVNGVAITESDIAASNGVIHPLQSVLMPPAAEESEKDQQSSKDE